MDTCRTKVLNIHFLVYFQAETGSPHSGDLYFFISLKSPSMTILILFISDVSKKQKHKENIPRSN